MIYPPWVRYAIKREHCVVCDRDVRASNVLLGVCDGCAASYVPRRGQ